MVNPVLMQEPIERESMAEQVARRLLDMVVAGSLKPGDQLPPERELATQLNVSRPTVREAIRGLTILGVAKTRQGGGAFISSLDADALLGPIQFFVSLEEVNLQELYHARSLIEGDVAREATKHISQEAIESLEKVLQDQKGLLNNPAAFRLSDRNFHSQLWEYSNNAFLKRIGHSLHSIGLEFRRRVTEDHNVLSQSYKDHCRLLDAIKAGDSETAGTLAMEHMQNVYNSSLDKK